MNLDKMKEASFRKTINPFIDDKEEWRRISDYIPGVYPYYYVSNTGKIFSEQFGYLLKFDYVGKGYLKVTLQFYDGPKDLLVHRIVMLCFEPIPNSHLYTVNHKDGNHENNFYSNLEWATYTEQMEHASSNNLLNKEGYTEEEIRAICSLLELTPNQDEVIEKIYGNIKRNNYPYYIRIKHLVNRIQKGDSWVNISSEYNILPKAMTNPNQILSEDQIHQVCRILEIYGRNYPTRKIFEMIGIDIGNQYSPNYTKYMSTMVNIRNRKTFHHITSKYNF